MLILAVILGLVGFGVFVWATLELRDAPGVEKGLLLAMLLGVLMIAGSFYLAYAALTAMA